jgi:membrane protease YdiL (CAAX protease family)
MKAHRTDSISLFFGLAFLMISGGYLATAYLDLDLPGIGWFVAAGLIFLGVVGAVTALVPSRQQAPAIQREEVQREEVEEEENDDTGAEQAR